ncbi:MAG: endonuclease/exonuclease/phosphatase family protein [Muribaculaceae bacterium]|nr:endonuclease/exonuclease/phosphatase family protein [Muribaculaceae bacterium]
MRIYGLLYALVISVICAFAVDAQSDTIRVRMMSYNLRFGELATLDEIGMHIKSFNPDFVALQEVDVNTNRDMAKHQNGKNFVAELSKSTGMFASFGRAIDLGKGYYGIAILSKYPIIKTETMMLPNPSNTEQRVLQYAWIDMGLGDTIVVAVTHLCHLKEDSRLEQGKSIIKRLAEIKYPLLIGGDFNTEPNTPVYNEFIKNNWKETSGYECTWPAWNPKEKIDFIFAYPAEKWKLLRNYTIPSCLSDHLPIVVDLEYLSAKSGSAGRILHE